MQYVFQTLDLQLGRSVAGTLGTQSEHHATNTIQSCMYLRSDHTYWYKVAFVVVYMVGRFVQGQMMDIPWPAVHIIYHQAHQGCHQIGTEAALAIITVFSQKRRIPKQQGLSTGQVSPQPRRWYIPEQPGYAPPRPQGALVGMTWADIEQSRSPYMGRQSSRARARVLLFMGPGCT